uniref:FLZ-type domain-containing protein n=1 Tax=Aegilops tauschii subsp. strangulata TaxID=200361 RepID=A0A453F052_AEGTS
SPLSALFLLIFLSHCRLPRVESALPPRPALPSEERRGEETKVGQAVPPSLTLADFTFRRWGFTGPAFPPRGNRLKRVREGLLICLGDLPFFFFTREPLPLRLRGNRTIREARTVVKQRGDKAFCSMECRENFMEDEMEGEPSIGHSDPSGPSFDNRRIFHLIQ